MWYSLESHLCNEGRYKKGWMLGSSHSFINHKSRLDENSQSVPKESLRIVRDAGE